MPHPPVDPGFFDKVNYVIDSWATPCEAPWYIYVECLHPAALEAFIVLITFGWDDVARGYFRPRGLGKRRTGKRKGKFRKAIPRFPELGELIGENIPGAERQKGKKWSELGKALWRIDGVMQRGLFWWLVVDVTNDFAYNFTSCLYDTHWCRASALGRFSWSEPTFTAIPGGLWIPLAFTVLDYEFPFPNWVIDFGNAGTTGCTASCAVNWKLSTFGPPASSFQTRLVDLDTGEVYKESGVNHLDPQDQSANIVSGGVGPGGRFQFEAKHNGMWAFVGDGVVTALANH